MRLWSLRSNAPSTSFPCPAASVIDAGFRANGVGLLGPNQFALLPFVFGNGDVTFSATILTVDLFGVNVYVWGGGVASNLAAPVGGFYLDVQTSQDYVTAPQANAAFSEFNVGNCTNNTIRTLSGVAATLGVNGNFLPVMGNFGDCVAGGGPGGQTGFAFNGGPVNQPVGLITNLTGTGAVLLRSRGRYRPVHRSALGRELPRSQPSLHHASGPAESRADRRGSRTRHLRHAGRSALRGRHRRSQAP
jgi:hypothetical protein